MKNRTIHIRELEQDDITDLDNHFGSQSVFKNPLSKWINYLTHQRTGTRSVRVIEIDNQVIGIATLKYISDYPSFKVNKIPEINDLLIAQPFRRQGFGRALIEALEIIAKEKGYKIIGLGVGLYQDYGSAQRLYFKLGYIPDGFGITYKEHFVVPGNKYPIDDELILWFTKPL